MMDIIITGGLEHEFYVPYNIYGIKSFLLTSIFFKMVKTTKQSDPFAAPGQSPSYQPFADQQIWVSNQFG